MRLLRITVALSAALTPLIAEAALSRPMPGTTDFPRASNPQVDVPVCYIETSSGTTLDLVSLCGSNADPPTPKNALPPPPGSGTNTPANSPNPANPGTPNPNGVTRDAVGTPTTNPAGTANPGNPAVANPGTSPAGNPNNSVPPGGGTAGNGSDGLTPNPNINLPRVPPSSFSPGGTAPTRDAIDGPRK
jgi:hypothetical protein